MSKLQPSFRPINAFQIFFRYKGSSFHSSTFFWIYIHAMVWPKPGGWRNGRCMKRVLSPEPCALEFGFDKKYFDCKCLSYLSFLNSSAVFPCLQLLVAKGKKLWVRYSLFSMALVAERAPVVNTEWVSLVLKDSDAATCGAKICEARIFLTEVLWAICDKKNELR